MIFVFGIDPNLDEAEIERAIRSWADGKVKTVKIGEDKKTLQKTAYVTFYKKTDRDMVLEMK